MDPGVVSHGLKADPPGYLWSKYDCFLMSGCWDIPHLRNFNVKLYEQEGMEQVGITNEPANKQTNEQTNEHICTDELKDENYITSV